MLQNSSLVKKVSIYVFLFYLNIEALIIGFFKKNGSKKDTILILKTDAIGDSIIWLDSAKEYRKYFPNHEITLLCNQSWLEIAERLPYFDKTISINRDKFSRNLKYRFSILKRLCKTKYEKIINPVFSRDYFVTDSLVRNIHATEKIGSVGNYENTNSALRSLIPNYTRISNKLKKKADKFYTKLIEATQFPLMELNRNAEFIRKYLNPEFQSQLSEIPFEIPHYKDLDNKKYVVLFIGASTLRKVWAPLEKYIDVINEISFDTIVLCGGKEDISLFEYFKEKISPYVSKNIINLIGKTDLIELLAVIKQAEFIITNDTSASHISVAVRTPSVCILGGGHFGRFQPYQVEKITEEDIKYLPKIVNYYMDCYNCDLICKYIKDKITTYPCIANISSEKVIDQIKKIQTSL